uniref:Uncharacterized protein n=1 Tax=Anguilla anguilla TaxID=7936 RepID=A0A0E9TW10_ANGAN
MYFFLFLRQGHASVYRGLLQKKKRCKE